MFEVPPSGRASFFKSPRKRGTPNIIGVDRNGVIQRRKWSL
jgi:hypothetical protein